MEFAHVPVLLAECIDFLKINPDGIYVDGTMGGAGHSLEIVKKLSKNGRLIGIDRDAEALNHSKNRLKDYSNVTFVQDNHDNIKSILESLQIEKVDGILLDLGVSSYQLDEPTRGFSYMHDAPLDMRMNKEDKFSAYDVVNKYSEEELTQIFYTYGEEKFSKKIAMKIVERRKVAPIQTTFELVECIKSALPAAALREKQHPAKRVFQAIRIEVNQELEYLKDCVKDSVLCLKPGGRLAIITFHSLEDRIVKKTYEDLEGKCICPKELPMCVCNRVSFGRIVTKKPIESNENELKINPRARSAKLRVFERI